MLVPSNHVAVNPYLGSQVIYEAHEHGLSPKNFHPEALNLCQTLQEAGFEAYIVGGGVRDALLHLNPKDLDIATSATPEQIQELFKRCILIGRRFRLAHVYLGPHIFEVATFRGAHADTHSDDQSQENDHGMITRDNVYGTLAEDAIRRDFTLNALYYDPIANRVIDYTQGMQDLRVKRIKTIGDPMQRFTEDPVRMLRALRIASKLNCEISEEIKTAIADKRLLLKLVSKARLFEEYKKMFLHGFSLNLFIQLVDYQLFEILFPTTAFYLKETHYYHFIEQSLKNTDARVQENKPVNPAFLIAVFLWPRYAHLKQHYKEKHANLDEPPPNSEALMSEVLSSQRLMLSLPRYLTQTIRDIWQLQPALEARKNKNIFKILNNKKFRAAYDFLVLREQLLNLPQGLTDWWTEIQTLPPEEQKIKIQALTGRAPNTTHKKKRRRKKPSSKTQ